MENKKLDSAKKRNAQKSIGFLLSIGIFAPTVFSVALGIIESNNTLF